jgi:hypothetical protein
LYYVFFWIVQYTEKSNNLFLMMVLAGAHSYVCCLSFDSTQRTNSNLYSSSKLYAEEKLKIIPFTFMYAHVNCTTLANKTRSNCFRLILIIKIKKGTNNILSQVTVNSFEKLYRYIVNINWICYKSEEVTSIFDFVNFC